MGSYQETGVLHDVLEIREDELERGRKNRVCHMSVFLEIIVGRGCANIWDLDRSYETLEAIAEKIGLTPDIHSYNALMCAFGKVKKTSEACKVFEHLVSLGVKPNTTTYTLLVDAHLANRDPKAVLLVIDEMPRYVHQSRLLRRGGGAETPVKYATLLQPDDRLHIGQDYRLVSFEEVLREFGSKKRVRLSRIIQRRKEREERKTREGGADEVVWGPALLVMEEELWGPASGSLLCKTAKHC
ncbi:hypothetical protein KFK09_009194 [Dendrobium nobile]|uniref:Pentatricopeptide repeat-containing protein n=1 Tax=Dendrobium nobile TaxID=94219 RepID=A0A8T3BN57_DENNO|nr:hypothetical protein KFK09_009194 [Dendrobium nobile]